MNKQKQLLIVLLGVVGLVLVIAELSLDTSPALSERQNFEVWAVDQGVGSGTLYLRRQ